MTQYIDKSAVMAEIEKIIADETESIKSFEHSKNVSERQRSNARIGVLTHLRSLLDTLEVKEVDLNESARHYLLHEHISPLNEVLHQVNLKVEIQYHKDIEDAYKAGFMLGLKTKKGE